MQLPVSPSSTTPMSSSSTLNAMPYTSPGNFTSSSKPTPGRPETLAMPVATLVIVPTSRGVSSGVKASRAWLTPANARSKTSARCWVARSFGLGRSARFRHCRRCRLCSGLTSRLGSGSIRLGFTGLVYGFGVPLASDFDSASRSAPTPVPATRDKPRCSKRPSVHSR